MLADQKAAKISAKLERLMIQASRIVEVATLTRNSHCTPSLSAPRTDNPDGAGVRADSRSGVIPPPSFPGSGSRSPRQRNKHAGCNVRKLPDALRRHGTTPPV